VRQAAVKLVELNGRQVIYAWVAGASNEPQHLLRDSLAARLPDYMLPAGISTLPELPISATGKIDYQALPAPQHLVCAQISRPPLGRLECALLALWEKALNRQDIGVHDNFFDVGGDSLAAIDILAGIEQLLGHKVSLYRLTEHPSIAQLAVALGDPEVDAELMLALNRHSGKIPLYLAASGHGDLMRFQALADSLGDVCDFYMLQPPGTAAIDSIEQLAKLYAFPWVASLPWRPRAPCSNVACISPGSFSLIPSTPAVCCAAHFFGAHWAGLRVISIFRNSA
jgi:acyl carrier protein